MKVKIDYGPGGHGKKDEILDFGSLDDAVKFALNLYPYIVIEHWSARYRKEEDKEWDYEITLYNGWLE